MATGTKGKATVVNLGKLEGLGVYLAATGVRIGCKGKVETAGSLYGRLAKGAARKVRKMLRAAGRTDWSGAGRN